MANPFAKSRPTMRPYAIYRAGDLVWHVVKTYKTPASEKKDPYASHQSLRQPKIEKNRTDNRGSQEDHNSSKENLANLRHQEAGTYREDLANPRHQVGKGHPLAEPQ